MNWTPRNTFHGLNGLIPTPYDFVSPPFTVNNCDNILHRYKKPKEFYWPLPLRRTTILTKTTIPHFRSSSPFPWRGELYIQHSTYSAFSSILLKISIRIIVMIDTIHIISNILCFHKNKSNNEIRAKYSMNTNLVDTKSPDASTTCILDTLYAVKAIWKTPILETYTYGNL